MRLCGDPPALPDGDEGPDLRRALDWEAGAVPAGDFVVNAVGSVHQSFTEGDGALIVDGSLLELLEEDAFASRKPGGDGASDGGRSVADLAHLTVPQLKLELRSRQLSAAGTKPTLLRRLLEALNEEDASAV